MGKRGRVSHVWCCFNLIFVGEFKDILWVFTSLT